MKHVSVLALSAMTTIGAIPFGALAAPISHLNSAGVIANNIATVQHSIMFNTFDNFGVAVNLGEYSSIKGPEHDLHEKCPPIYGELRPYGEYGDDGTVFQTGRSGGDLTTSNYNWFDWNHYQGKTGFKDFDKVNSKYDLISMGFANEPQKTNDGYSQFGVFGGLVMGHENANSVSISENGGLIGVFQGYRIDNLNLAIAADFGLLFSDSKAALGDYDYTNFWFGAGANTSYNISINESFTLQPGAYVGYTWIHSNGYEAATGAGIPMDGSHMFEITPSLRGIMHMDDGWYTTVFGRYAFNFASGGDTKIAGTTIPALDLKDYVEYGVSVEKNAERFGFSVSLGRHDGGRTGWIGDIQVRYVF